MGEPKALRMKRSCEIRGAIDSSSSSLVFKPASLYLLGFRNR